MSTTAETFVTTEFVFDWLAEFATGAVTGMNSELDFVPLTQVLDFRNEILRVDVFVQVRRTLLLSRAEAFSVPPVQADDLLTLIDPKGNLTQIVRGVCVDHFVNV